MNTKLMFSSEDMTWATPVDFFSRLDDEFHFTLDVCANEQNHKCDRYFSPKDDGLSQKWGGQKCWMNPPYGKEMPKWIRKAYQESLLGAVVVCLIPSRTDTKVWHECCMKAAEIRFVRGRIKFGDGKNSAPFPSAVIVFDGTKTDTKVTGYDH